MDFPVFEDIHQHVEVGFVEGHLVVPAKVVNDARIRIDLSKVLGLAGVIGVAQPLEQEGVVAGFDADDVTHTGVGQVAEVGSVGAQSVLDDNDRQVGMLLAKAFQPAARGVAFAIILGGAVLLDDRLGRQRDDLLEVGMHEGSAQHLVMIGDAAAAMVLDQARRALDLAGGKIAGAVQGQQVRAVEKDEILQDLAALQTAKDIDK